MRRLGTAAGILVTALLLGGCGKNEMSNSAETIQAGKISSAVIELQKDGSVVETITEEFTKNYYNEENLKNMLLSEVADYNNGSENGNLSVERFENKEGKLMVQLKYPSTDAYTDYNTNQYNDSTIFCGTVAEAYDAGYSFDISMTDSKGEETIGKEELLGMGENRMLITKVPVRVKLPGKIMYAGENIIVESRNQAIMQADENGDALGTYYIVFK